ncbi:MAG: Gfo/Idh/MocA family oxidoreductase [Cytophagaceae bacterium]|nr:Gfo/Idh/MocA family oxidoreductase [Cytophagaceae bacterium]
MKTNRRDFIQRLAGASLGASALPFLADANASSEVVPYAGKTLNVAILGLGSYGTRVAEAMKECKQAKLVGAVSGTPAKLEQWKSKYGLDAKNLYNYENFDSIKNNPDIDVVYVITPNVLHKDFAIRAAKAGKHVITEKPMAGNVKDAQEMIAACQKAGVKLMVGYRLHFEPFTRELIRLRESGELGKILHVNTQTGFRIGDPNQWRLKRELAGGGGMMDIGIYSINAVRYGSGEEPIWVTAQEVKTDPVKFKEGIDETITFQMGLPNGIIASCSSSYNFNNADRIFVAGDKGFAELAPATGYGPLKGRTNKGPMDQPVVTHQAYQMDGMADIILNGKSISPPVDGQEGLKDMKIIEAIYESIRQDGKRINLKG